MADTIITGNPRHDQLIQYVNEMGYVTIEDLAIKFGVSSQTVRRDIKKISDDGMLIRNHGGASRCADMTTRNYEQRQFSQTKEKEAIAAAIADYLPDYCTVFIAIGTTSEIIAKHLHKRTGLQIVTNSLPVANRLYSNDSFDVMVPGGKLRSNNGGIVGMTVIEFLKHFKFDYLITSLGAIDIDGTMLDYDFNEVAVVKAAMANTRNVLVAADATKFSASAAVQLGSLTDISVLFTDMILPLELSNLLKKHNVKEIIVKPES